MSETLERAAKATAVGNAAAVRSMMLRLELGLVYCRLSEGSSDDADAARVHSRAQNALDSAVFIAGFLSLTQDDRSEFDAKAALLHDRLAAGENGEAGDNGDAGEDLWWNERRKAARPIVRIRGDAAERDRAIHSDVDAGWVYVPPASRRL